MIEKIDFEIRRTGFRAMGRAAGAFMFGCSATVILTFARSVNPNPTTPGEIALF